MLLRRKSKRDKKARVKGDNVISLACGKKLRKISLQDTENFLYLHRIKLGRVLESAKGDFELFQGVINAMCDHVITVDDVGACYSYVEEVTKDLQLWIEWEKRLHYEPTSEEISAGIESIGSKIPQGREFSVIDSLASRMGISHDEVQRLPYGRVCGILELDLDKAMYQRRLQQQANAKHR